MHKSLFCLLFISFQGEVCPDYLRKFRDFGSEISCGFQNPNIELEPLRIQMEFRSNTRLVQFRFCYSLWTWILWALLCML